MSWADDMLAGGGAAKRPTAADNPFAPVNLEEKQSYTGGFVNSLLSGIPEAFGAPATLEAERFRAENPVGGFVSEMLPLLSGYGGVELATTRIPALASRLESATGTLAGRLGLTAESAPIRTSMLRETLRFAPFEASRLAVGGMVYPEHLDNLFADVALNSVFTVGGIGALGGLMRAGGRVLRSTESRVLGGDIYASPTFSLREAMEEGAQVAGGDLTLPELRARLTQEVFTERTPIGGVSKKELPYVRNLQGATEAADEEAVNSLFKISKAKEKETTEGLRTKLFTETEAEIKNTLNPGERASIIQKLGFESEQEFAATVQFPRLHEVPERRAAKQLATILDKPVWQSAGPDIRWTRTDNGLFTMSIRVESGRAKALAEGAGAAAPRGRGAAKVSPGDRWVTFQTDKPGLFAPDLQRVADATVAAWARWRLPYQPPRANADVFNAANDVLQRMLTTRSYQDMRRMTKKQFLAEYSEEAAQRLGAKFGVRSSETVRATLDFAYDVLKPTIFKEYQDTLYGRLFGMLKSNVETGRRYVHQMTRGTARVKGSGYGAVFNPRNAMDLDQGFMGHDPIFKRVYQLSEDDIQDVVRVGTSRVPVEDIDSLVSEGTISAAAGDFLRYMREVDTDFLNTVIKPALRPLGERGNVEFRAGAYIPRVWEGDFRVQVVNEQGREVFLAARKTAQLAQRDADVYIEEAAKLGRNFKAQPLKTVLDDDSEVVNELIREAGYNVMKGSDEDKIIRAAMRRISTLDNRSERLTAPTPGTLRKRTGRRGSPDVQRYTHEDLANNIEAHYNKLATWTARQAWQERYAQEAFLLKSRDATLYRDLMRKANQYIGVEGRLTNALNKSLEPLLGPVLGRNAATKIASATNEILYHWQLALFNPTFAVLNALTPVMTVLPQIAYTLSVPRFEAAKLLHFHPTFDEFGKPLGTAASLSPLKILWQAYKDASAPDEGLKNVIGQLIDDGKLAAHLRDEVSGSHSAAFQTLNEMLREGKYLRFMKEGSVYMANKSEQFARMISANAGYRVGKDVIGLEGDELVRFTGRFVEIANFNYGVVDRSRLFTGPIGSMFGLFKNWQMHYMGMMVNYAQAAWKYNIWAPFMWQNASALAIGGLGATPLVHLADGLSNWAAGEPDSFLWMQENWHDGADNIWFGLPSFLGVSLQASASIPGTDVRNEAASLGNFVILERAKAIGKALGSAAQYQSATGENALRNPNIRDSLMGALTPRAFYRAASVVEGNYVKSMSTGSPMVQDPSPAAQMLQGLGVNVTEIERYQVAAKRLWKKQDEKRALLQGLGMQYADAMAEGDVETMERVLVRSVGLGVSIDKVAQSAHTRNRREQGDLLSRYDKTDRARYMRALDQVGR